MAGFFSLGGGGGGAGGRVGNNNIYQDLHQNINPPNAIPLDAWYWYRNNDNPYQGLDLFQHQAQLLQQRQQLQQQQDLYSTAVGLGVGPSRNAINLVNGSPSRSTPMRGGRVGSSSCQDCGNQAKKDCPHMRCRTCCKARGFDCSTHVKSTWVPASKRRERQQQVAEMQKQRLEERLQQEDQARGGNSKRQRENPSSSSLASGLEDGDFPEEVSFQVGFRCVRVSSLDDDDDQYAYKTAVTIGGHIFKGILYDQGPDNNYTTGESSTGGDGGGGFQAPAALNFIPADPIPTTSATVSTTVTGGLVTAPSSSAYLDPSTLYPTPLHTFMAGTQFFPSPRSP
ncbi:protein SHI RELATED SEQUENCE 1 [Pistacia vera]|uniref:protein SHI RELATED SEQUENCE 1 n=1 Tax=Pistacia vera TaxID=55513 RepID=UPI0012636945|nr:protein SHI RELATED SEQUENCE 1 [Pistacia vera]